MLVNQDDPVKASLVDDRIQALITEANLLLSQRISDQAADYLNLLIKGGQISLPIVGDLNILGLQPSSQILRQVQAQLPPNSTASATLDEVIKFSDLARQNLDFALPLLGAVASPISVDKIVVAGQSSELDVFAIAVAATVTLMFVTVLLVAGSLALEREENVFARITRGLVGTTGLLTEKVLLGIIASYAVTLLLLVALTALVSVDWGTDPADPARDRRGRRRLRRLRCGDRRVRQGGPGELAVGVHGLAADRLPLPRPLRDGQRRRLSRDRDHPRAVSVRSGARRHAGSARLRRPRASACRSSTCSRSSLPTGSWRGWRCGGSLRRLGQCPPPTRCCCSRWRARRWWRSPAQR